MQLLELAIEQKFNGEIEDGIMTRNEFIKLLKENLKPNAQMDFLLIDKINGKDFVGFLDIKDVCMNVDVDDPNNRNRGGVVFSVIKNLMEKDL